MDFDLIASTVRGLRNMTPEQGRRIYDHVRETRPRANVRPVLPDREGLRDTRGTLDTHHPAQSPAWRDFVHRDRERSPRHLPYGPHDEAPRTPAGWSG